MEEVKGAVDLLLELVPTEDKDNAMNIIKELVIDISFQSTRKMEDVRKNGFGWISVKDTTPPHDIMAVVCNAAGWMHYSRAVYNASYNVWVKCDLGAYDNDILAVTHYIPIPPCPTIERKDKE